MYSIIVIGIIGSFLTSIYAYKDEKYNGDGVNNVTVVNESAHCVCSTYTCGCCSYVNIPVLKGIVCANASVLPQDYGFSITVTYNNYTVYNETISVRNPPAMCAKIPDIEEVEICLRLYNLEFENSEFSACGSIKIQIYYIIHQNINLGCFHIPPDNAANTIHLFDLNIYLFTYFIYMYILFKYL